MKMNGRIQLFPVLRLVLFLVVGIVLGEEFYSVVHVYVWFAALVVSFVIALFVRKHCVAQTVFIFVSMMSLGGYLAAYELSTLDVKLPKNEICYSAVIVSPPVISGKVVRCDMIVTDQHSPFKIRASIYRDNRAESIKAGYGVKAVSMIEKPENLAGSDFDYRRYMLYHGFVGTTFLYIDDWCGADVDLRKLSLIERTKIAALLLRNKLLDIFRSLGFEGQGYAVLAAMVLGERVTISDELNDDYSVSGAMHVLSLSGLHLGIIYAMLSLLFLGRRRLILTQVVVLCAIWTYVVIVGMPISAVRSAVMLTVYSFVCLLNREPMSLNALAVSAFVLLVCNPLNLYDVGFQMSFASVFFILVFYHPLYMLLPVKIRTTAVIKRIWQMSAVSIAAQAGVAPLVAFYFGRFSCYFLLTNFIVVPAATVILYGAVFVMFTGWLPLVQSWLCYLLAKVVNMMNSGVSFIASLPYASIEGIRLNIIQVIAIYVIMFSLYILFVHLRKMFWGFKLKT